MTKLLQWLAALAGFLCLWVALLEQVKGQQGSHQSPCVKTLITFLPVILVGVLGVLSLFAVLWKTYNFNDCPKAAEELKREIKQAREELKRMKLKF